MPLVVFERNKMSMLFLPKSNTSALSVAIVYASQEMSYPPCRCRLKCVWLSKLARNTKKVKKDAPALFELLIALIILCILLLIDIVWLGHVHSEELKELEQLHDNDLGRFRKQFDAQMHAVNLKQKKLGSDLEDAHAEDVNRLKVNHQQELEKKISSIQEQLNSLLGMSKNYWDKHVENNIVNSNMIYKNRTIV